MKYKSIIGIIAYNPEATILKLLNFNYPTVIIDNSETKSDWLEKECVNKSIKYQWLGENLGIATALNIAAEHALITGYNFLITLDQDSMMTSSLLESMSRWIDTYNDISQIGIFCSKQHSNINCNAGNNSIFIMTSGSFINLNIWQAIGKFNDALFIDGVDIEYCIRIMLGGYKSIVNETLMLIHRPGYSIKINFLGRKKTIFLHSPQRLYYIVRNYLYIMYKYNKNNSIPELKTLKSIILEKYIYILFHTQKLLRMKFLIRGVIDYYKGIYGKYK